MTMFLNKKFKVYAGKLTGLCVKEARDCINYGIKCDSCVRIQGKYTNYERGEVESVGK